jgi:CRP/FNR family transcriptional regulator, nitrogen fixation regulation protein
MAPLSESWLRGSGREVWPALDDALRLLESMAEFRRCPRGFHVYRSGDGTGYWYQIVAGAAKRYSSSAAGRQQIVEFLLPGDWFGQSLRLNHEFTAEILAPGTVVSRYPYLYLRKMLELHPRPMLGLIDVMCQSTARLEKQLQVLGRVSAQQRVGAFLLEMATRSGEPAGITVLAMSRYDIADFLLMSVETVSRAITHWKLSGAIEMVSQRRIRILDAPALQREDDPVQ